MDKLMTRQPLNVTEIVAKTFYVNGKLTGSPIQKEKLL